MKRKNLSAWYNSRGFTLIELLIVIALLGALAVGLLATIDPFEQLKKGRDTSKRNTVSEFYNANLRYYAIKSEFPWGTNVPTAFALNTVTATYVQSLVDSGELKNRFAELAGTAALAQMYLYSASSDAVAVCFRPESKSFQIDPNTMYDQSGGTTIATCKSSGGTSDCYFCIQ